MDEIEKRYRELQRLVLSQRFDANETFHLERELTQLRAKIFEVQYPALLARSFAPKANDIASSAETYSYKVYSVNGKAQHKSYGASDHPKISVVSREVLGKVRPITGWYGWDFNELRESVRNNTRLSEVQARAARDFIERGIDETLAFGAISDQAGDTPDLGCSGLVNNPDVAGAANVNVMSGGFWLNPSPLDPKVVLKDMNDLVAKPGQASKQMFEADTLILPKTHFDYVRQTPFSEIEGTSILDTFKKNNPQVTTVAPWHVLDSVSAAQGGDAKPRAIAYKKDPMVLEAVIPQEFETMPPEARGYEFLIFCHARCGGAKVYYPVGMKYMDFATS